MKTPKYHLYCTKCGAEIDNFGTWFSQGQKCNCGCSRAEVKYFTDYSRLKDLCSKENLSEGLFRYFDFLPLNDINDAVTLGEGTVPLERWQFLEDLAKEKYGIDCKVVVTPAKRRTTRAGRIPAARAIARPAAAVIKFGENRGKSDESGEQTWRASHR